MSKTNEERNEWNKQAYGFADIDDYVKQIDRAHKFDTKLNGRINGVASTLSDAQELLEFGDYERVRQMLNIAKYVLFTTRIDDRGVTRKQYDKAVKKLTKCKYKFKDEL